MPGITLFIPIYNCERQIGRVVDKLVSVQALFAEILVIDNRSTDGSLAAAKTALAALDKVPVTLITNDRNYFFGGSHKIAFDHALEKGSEYLLILHGDDQANINDAIPALTDGVHADLTLGARFHPDSKLIGYSKFRTWGNLAINRLASLVLHKEIDDTGSGLNIYSRRVFADRDYLSYPDDLTFSTCLLFDCIRKHYSFRFFPLSWREEDQVSNAKVVRQGLRIVGMLLRYALGQKNFLPRTGQHAYTYEVVYESARSERR